ncbi:MAG: CoA transferase, family, partial [Rhodospirillales bacterium]|nr:CoA transferase, family [Rhodospirillales bacterium]
GPVATRFLAGYGAEILRIDPPSWDEPAIIPEITPGKRCARLDLHQRGDRDIFERLLAEADVLVHGYRPGALERLGFGVDRRRTINPTLVDVSLDAYGWTGPWKDRRGFDSLVQMSTGIAEAGLRHYGKNVPTPLPVQALDHGAGYLMAATVVRGLSERLTRGGGSEARTSLARVATLLLGHPAEGDAPEIAPRAPGDFSDSIERTEWGDLKRLVPPASISGAPMYWDRPAERLGASAPVWSTR